MDHRSSDLHTPRIKIEIFEWLNVCFFLFRRQSLRKFDKLGLLLCALITVFRFGQLGISKGLKRYIVQVKESLQRAKYISRDDFFIEMNNSLSTNHIRSIISWRLTCTQLPILFFSIRVNMNICVLIYHCKNLSMFSS